MGRNKEKSRPMQPSGIDVPRLHYNKLDYLQGSRPGC